MELTVPGDSGCLKSTGGKKQLHRRSTSGCATFKFDGKQFLRAIGGDRVEPGYCLAIFSSRYYGLWTCNHKIAYWKPTGDKFCSTWKPHLCVVAANRAAAKPSPAPRPPPPPPSQKS